jgi:ribokinase
VLTDGPCAVRIFRHGSTELVDPPPAPDRILGDDGTGDSFVDTLSFFLAHGLSIEKGC